MTFLYILPLLFITYRHKYSTLLHIYSHNSCLSEKSEMTALVVNQLKNYRARESTTSNTQQQQQQQQQQDTGRSSSNSATTGVSQPYSRYNNEPIVRPG